MSTKFKVGQSHKMYTFDNNSILSVKEWDNYWQNKLYGRYKDCFVELSQEIKDDIIACISECGNLDCLKYAHQNGCPWYEHTCPCGTNVECSMLWLSTLLFGPVE